MEASGQFHTPAALPRRKNLTSYSFICNDTYWAGPIWLLFETLIMHVISLLYMKLNMFYFRLIHADARMYIPYRTTFYRIKEKLQRYLPWGAGSPYHRFWLSVLQLRLLRLYVESLNVLIFCGVFLSAKFMETMKVGWINLTEKFGFKTASSNLTGKNERSWELQIRLYDYEHLLSAFLIIPSHCMSLWTF